MTATVDWEVHIDAMRKKPWILYRDDLGNLYTIYPPIEENKFIVVRDK